MGPPFETNEAVLGSGTQQKTVAVILAAGEGQRTGFASPKQLVKLAGKPILAHTLERFQSHEEIDEIAIVTSASFVREVEDMVNRESATKVKKVLIGGQKRYESSLSALLAYESEAKQRRLRIIFHDAVRPLVDAQIISDVIKALDYYKAVDVAIPATDTILEIDPISNTIANMPERSRIRLGQTPQGFHFETIRSAYHVACQDPRFDPTDDCGVVLKYLPEEKVFVVNGAVSNLKLTLADDLLVLDKFMQTNAAKRLRAEHDTLSLSKLRGLSIVVFGGTSGIGAAMVEMATVYGAKVFSFGKSTGTDISAQSDVLEAFQKVLRSSPQIDAVVNTAGILTRQPLNAMSDQEISESINTNFLGAVNVAKLAFSHLQQTKGHLLLFSSSSYTYGRAYYALYSAAKAAIVNLTQALSDEWSEFGIRVNCINPQRTQTPMRVQSFGIEPEESLLKPAEVAQKALSVLLSSYTGHIFDIFKS